MNQPLKVAIIGCGVIAPSHLVSYARRATVLWLCDVVEEKARTLAHSYGVPNVTTDYQQVLADPEVDAISVCTDHASHATICIDTLRAGKHVLCEKALAASSAGLDAMMAEHAQHPELVFSGVFQHRFEPFSRLLLQLIEEGAFGTILTAGLSMNCLRTPEYYNADAWRGTWAKEGGSVLINQAIHFIDLLTWLMGGVTRLCATYDNLTHGTSIETEDTAVACLRFANGALGTITATSSSHLEWEPILSISGTHGSLHINNHRCTKAAFADEALQQTVQARLKAATNPEALEVGKVYYGGGHAAQIADFIDAIEQQRAPFVSAASARHAVDVVLAIYRAHRESAWVAI